MSVCILGISLLVAVKTAKAEVPDSYFRVTVPYALKAEQSTNVFMEIAQVGTGAYKNGVKLDAPEAWAKYYIDPERVDKAILGVFNGGYGGNTDVLGRNSGTVGNNFPGESIAERSAVRYDYYLAQDTGFQGVPDEKPCTKPGTVKDYVASATRYSSEMPSNGWYKKLTTAQFLKNARCNNNKWQVTAKSGKYVIFVRARWNSPQPTDGGDKLGRLNAFKVGAAYSDADPNNKFDNPITGYWSNLSVATHSDPSDIAAYSVQDRIFQDGTQGDYEFDFATDCRLAVGKSEQRFLHWKDIDYPDYYGKNDAPPEFDLYEIDPSGRQTLVKDGDVRANKKLPNGTYPFNGENKENIHNYFEFTGKGGYKYRWVWRNITRIDGISLWLPYDDYGYYRGCGSYEHKLDLWGGSSSSGGMTTTEFKARGGDVVNFLVDEQYVKGTAQAPNTTTNAYISGQGTTKFADALNDPIQGQKISDNGRWIGRAQANWELPGMGPGKPYTSRRWLLFSYQVKGDAKDGARYCVNADMIPESDLKPEGTLKDGPLCFTIDNSLKPFITTSGADVHAGDCQYVNPAAQIGKITGVPVNGLNQGSSGQYIVSAADAITNFGSGGSPNGSALTFGKGGFYGSMCRPTMAQVDPTKERGVEILNGNAQPGPFDLGKLNPGKRYVVQFGGDGEVVGTARASVTVYAPNGTVTIKTNGGNAFGSDVKNQYARKQLPTVGVTAKNIRISNSVVALTAALYASGNITTCAENTVAACRSTLLLNGFAMARDFNLNRTGTGQNGLQLAEYLRFNPAIYLNPPPGDGTVGDLAQYLGERAPLY